MRPVESRIASQGAEGAAIAKKIARARDTGEVAAGKRLEVLGDSGLIKLEQDDRDNLVDSLQGVARPQNSKVQKAFDAVRSITDEIASEAEGLKVQVKEKRTAVPGFPLPTGAKLTGKQQDLLVAGKKVPYVYVRPFKRLSSFYPHIIPTMESLKSGPIRKEVISNMVRMGVRPDEMSAAKFLENCRKFIDKGGRTDDLEQYMVDTGQATNKANAYMLLMRFRKRHIQRQGSLEYARQVDLPFYDPNPVRVLPPFIHSASLRLAHIRELGQSNEEINTLIRRIDKAGGNATFVRAAVDRILGIVDEPDKGLAKLSRWLRVIQGFKLGLSAIPNVIQGARNSLLAGDLPSTIAGGRGLFTRAGRRFAARSGASIDSVITEMTRYAGANESRALTMFLKGVGFTQTEQANRIWAANAGLEYTKRMLRRLRSNPHDGRALKVLEELGIDGAAVVKRGKITGDEALLAAKRFSDLSQFRSGPQDLPFFASSSIGRVFFQLKQYIYGQTRMFKREVIDELRAKRYGRAMRSLLILATVFPLSGEVIQDVRAWLTGRKRPTGALARYFDDLAAGSSLGVLSDVITSGHYGQTAEFIGGPTVGDISTLIESSIKDVEKGRKLSDLKKSALLKQTYRRIPLLGSLTVNRVFPVVRPKQQETVVTPQRKRHTTGRTRKRRTIY